MQCRASVYVAHVADVVVVVVAAGAAVAVAPV